MNEITTVGLDLAKRVLSLCGDGGSGRVVVQRMLRREAVLGWSVQRPPCLVGMKACSSALVRAGAGRPWAHGTAHCGGVRAAVPAAREEQRQRRRDEPSWRRGSSPPTSASATTRRWSPLPQTG